MWGRLSVLALAVLTSALAACSVGEDGQEQAATTTSTRPPPARTTTEGEEKKGGLLDTLGGLLGADETSRCVGDVAASSGGGSRATRLRAIAHEVERLRHLRFERVPRPRYLKPGALERRIRTELEGYPAAELQADGHALVALGALPAGTDLKALLRQALAGQVAGFYDPRTGELVVGSDARARLDAEERITLAHELEHALADQALEFPAYLESRRPAEGREDAALAGLSLIEGDATLVMQAFAAENLSLADAFRSIGSALTAEDQLEELPYYLQASTVFPYLEGLAFVCTVFDRGGWKAVDAAYRKPPTTSAQVMFPERYFARELGVDPPRPQPPGRGWRRLDRTAVGAADLLWLFEAPGGETSRELSDARERAAAWAGGELSLWGQDERIAVSLTLVERRGERDLCASIRAWFKAAERHGAVRCSGRIIRASLKSS